MGCGFALRPGSVCDLSANIVPKLFCGLRARATAGSLGRRQACVICESDLRARRDSCVLIVVLDIEETYAVVHDGRYSRAERCGRKYLDECVERFVLVARGDGLMTGWRFLAVSNEPYRYR